MIGDLANNLRQQGSFLRNLTISLSGQSFAIVIGLFFTPFIARIYSPEAYGLFAFFLSISQNLAIIATLQLPRAFVLPEKDKDFRRLLHCSIIAVTFVTCLTVCLLLIFNKAIISHFGVPSDYMKLLVFFIPFAVLLLAINDVLKSWNVRMRKFQKNAINHVFSSSVAKGTTLSYGLGTSGNVWGLIIGDVTGKFIENVFLLRELSVRQSVSIRLIAWRRIKQTLKEYRNYPLFILPGVWVQSLIMQLPVYYGLFFYAADSSGHYSFAVSLLNLPVNILAAAMAPVFLQKASDTYRKNSADMGRIVGSMANRLFYLGLIPMTLLMVLGDQIFRVALGEQWIESGRLASFMGVYFLFMMINYPLSSLYRIYRKERQSLFIQILFGALSLFALWVGSLIGTYLTAIAFFSFSLASYYLVNIFIVLNLSGLDASKVIWRWLLRLIVTFSAF